MVSLHVKDYRTPFTGITIRELTCTVNSGRTIIYKHDFLSRFQDLKFCLEQELNSRRDELYDVMENLLEQTRKVALDLKEAIYTPSGLAYDELPSNLRSIVTKDDYDFAKEIYKKYQEQAEERLLQTAKKAGVQGEHLISDFIMGVLQPKAVATERTITLEEAMKEFGYRRRQKMMN